jgi:hypothetical protein
MMPTYITTLHFTEQGIKAVRDTCDGAAAFLGLLPRRHEAAGKVTRSPRRIAQTVVREANAAGLFEPVRPLPLDANPEEHRYGDR